MPKRIKMNSSAMARHLPLPAGVHHATQEILSFARCLAEPGSVADLDSMPRQWQITLLKARWRAGAWADKFISPGGFVNLDKALRVVGDGSAVGEILLRQGLVALKLIHLHAGQI